MIKVFLLSLLLFCSPCLASLFPLTLNELNGQCGPHVRVYAVTLDGPLAATGANEKLGGEYIVMDSGFMISNSRHAVWFVFFHECGHRVNGHMKGDGNLNKQQEADCYAATRFVKTFGYRRLEATLEELLPINTEARNKRILECVR